MQLLDLFNSKIYNHSGGLMSILEIKGLTHRYDDRFLFQNADLVVNNGEHIGIVGLNGAGKSTFINIISRRISQDEGEVNWLSGIRTGYLDQHATIDKSLTVMDYLSSAFTHLYEKNARLEEMYAKMCEVDGDELDVLIKRSAKLQEELDGDGFYDLDSQIKKVANGLGVNKFGYDAVISTLSGGERAKLMLSKLLLEKPDVMLLDEPTNFLDIEHIDWLEKFLNSYKKTFLVISHDTLFLNKVCKVIVAIENGNIEKYSGNYDDYLKLREIKQKQYEDSYRRQQGEIKKLQDYIDKNKARAATAGMAHSRQKMLDKMEILQKPTTVYEARFKFPYVSANAKDFLKVTGLEVGYSSALIPPIDIHMSSQTKLWIRGTNGVGKTTLLKTLMRKIAPLGGSFCFHPSAKILYLEQELTFENPNVNALSYYSSFYPRLSLKELRSALAEVGIKGELAQKPLCNLSGGEQVKVKLAVLSRSTSNFLILDEPTNHLDVVAKNALKNALKDYEGALILVCHETDFASEICSEIFDAKSR